MKKKRYRFKSRNRKLDYANEGRDEEFDSFRSVMIALTSGAVGILFALLTSTSAIVIIRSCRVAYGFAMISFVAALCLLLLSYGFGYLYFDVHYDTIKRGHTRCAKEVIYAFLDNCCVCIASILFITGLVSAGYFVYALITISM